MKDKQTMNEVHQYVINNPRCSYIDILQEVGSTGETVSAIYHLRQRGAIFEPQQDEVESVGDSMDGVDYTEDESEKDESDEMDVDLVEHNE